MEAGTGGWHKFAPGSGDLASLPNCTVKMIKKGFVFSQENIKFELWAGYSDQGSRPEFVTGVLIAQEPAGAGDNFLQSIPVILWIALQFS